MSFIRPSVLPWRVCADHTRKRLSRDHLENYIDYRSSLNPRDHRFRIHLFGDRELSVQAQVSYGTTHLHDVGLMEYLQYASRDFVG